MFLFPAIDLRDGKVVRLFKGDYDRQTTYALDPLEQARAFENAGATWLHLVDLDGARASRVVHLAVIEQICKNTKLKVEVGGGVRSSASVDELLGVGVNRVILGTAALKDWPWFESLVREEKYHGKIVLGLDARNGELAVSGWESQTGQSAVEVAKKVTDWPLSAIIYTDIATDGTLAGPNITATRQLARATKIPVVSSGGVGTLTDLIALRKEIPRLQGAIVGKAIYENRFTVEQAIHALEH